MEDTWVTDRTRLRQRWRQHRTWRVADFAAALNRSVGWVVQWLRRIRAAPDADTVLSSQSCAPLADWVAQVRQDAVAEQRRVRHPRVGGAGRRASAGWMTTLKAAGQVQAAEERATQAFAPGRPHGGRSCGPSLLRERRPPGRERSRTNGTGCTGWGAPTGRHPAQTACA